MEPIRVPRPPTGAFNKHRRVSDLIRKQVHHFKHLEQKLPEQLRSEIPQHSVVTEEDAARYIAHMTQLLLPRGQAAALEPTEPKRSQPKGKGLALAAAADRKENSSTRKKAAKKASARPRKGTKR